MNKEGLSKKCRVSLNSVTGWVRKGCPHSKQKDGTYHFDLAKVEVWRKKTSKVNAPISATFADAQRRKENALADLREMEVSRKRGELVERKQVEGEAFKTGRLVRDSILALPDRLSGVLAAETDQGKVHLLLTKELRQALEGLHNKFSKELEPVCR